LRKHNEEDRRAKKIKKETSSKKIIIINNNKEIGKLISRKIQGSSSKKKASIQSLNFSIIITDPPKKR